MIKNVLRYLAVIPASALAYCLGCIITLVITRIIFYDEQLGLIYSTNPEQSEQSWFELFFGSLIINSGASVSAIVAADFVAPSVKKFFKCIALAMSIGVAIYIGMQVRSLAFALGLFISFAFIVYNLFIED
jgi:hypothetical protein